MSNDSDLRECNVGPCRIMFSFMEEKDGYPYVYIGSCKVHESERGKGKFRVGLSSFLNGVDAAGFKVKLVAIPDASDKLQRLVDFYQSFGFQRTGTLLNGIWPEMERL